MRNWNVRMGLVVLSVILGHPLWQSQEAAASPIPVIESYSTTGTVYPHGVTGTPVVNFQGVSAGTWTTGDPLNLGQFTLNTTGGGSTTYDHTLVLLQFQVNQINGQAPQSNETPITIEGELDGTVSSSGKSTLSLQLGWVVFPEFGSPFSTTFHAGDFLNTLQLVHGGKTALFQDSNNQGTSQLQAVLDATLVPEPGTIVGFGMLIACAVLSRKIASAQQWSCNNASEEEPSGSLVSSRDP